VVEIRAGADDKIDEAVFHQGQDAATQASGSQRAGHGQADRDIFFWIKHLFGVEARRFIQTRGIVRLELFVNQLGDGHAGPHAMGQDLCPTQVTALFCLLVLGMILVSHASIIFLKMYLKTCLKPLHVRAKIEFCGQALKMD
jgi:hypothetical protein